MISLTPRSPARAVRSTRARPARERASQARVIVPARSRDQPSRRRLATTQPWHRAATTGTAAKPSPTTSVQPGPARSEPRTQVLSRLRVQSRACGCALHPPVRVEAGTGHPAASSAASNRTGWPLEYRTLEWPVQTAARGQRPSWERA